LPILYLGAAVVHARAIAKQGILTRDRAGEALAAG
jgi:hypothetical protein